MKRRTSMMGTLLGTFRAAKVKATEDGKAALWDRNDLKNPKTRHKYEIRESVVNSSDKTDIILELWQKIDSEHIRLTANIEAGTVDQKSNDEIDELMNG